MQRTRGNSSFHHDNAHPLGFVTEFLVENREPKYSRPNHFVQFLVVSLS